MSDVKMPQYRMFWSAKTRFPEVAAIMSRNRFDNLRTFFMLTIIYKCYLEIMSIMINYSKSDHF